MKNNSILSQALSLVKRNQNGSADQQGLYEAVADLLPDDKEDKLRRAKRIVNAGTKPGGTAPEGQLALPFDGFEPFPYLPNRLIRDGKQKTIIEQAKVSDPKYTYADWMRAQKNRINAQKWEDRKAQLHAGFERWRTDRFMAGDALDTITFDRYVKDEGVWREGDLAKPDPYSTEDE